MCTTASGTRIYAASTRGTLGLPGSMSGPSRATKLHEHERRPPIAGRNGTAAASRSARNCGPATLDSTGRTLGSDASLPRAEEITVVAVAVSFAIAAAAAAAAASAPGAIGAGAIARARKAANRT